MSPRRTLRAATTATEVADEPHSLTTDLTSVLPIDREEFNVMIEALGLDAPSRLSPLPALVNSTDRIASRAWTEIRAPLDTMADSTFAEHVAPIVAPDRILDIRGTAFEAAPAPVRLYSSRRCGPNWAGLRAGAARDHELLAPYVDGDIDYFALLNLSLSTGSEQDVPWESLTGTELAFFCALVDAWRTRFHLASFRRRPLPTPVTIDFDDILEAQRDGWKESDRRWLLTALSEALGLLVHPGGDVGVTLPMLTVEQLQDFVRQWAERGWIEVITKGPNPVLQLGAPIAGAVMSFLAWTTMVVLHDVEVVGMTRTGPAAHEELLLFIVTGPVIWAFVTQGLTSATDDVSQVTFRMQSVSAEEGVETVARFLEPNNVTLPDDVYAPIPRAAAPPVTAVEPVQPAPTPAPTPAPPAPTPPPWVPTHVAPTGGLPAWTTPDAAAAPAATLDAGLDVQLLEQHETGWARVACSNGWIAWVDGRLLVSR